MEKKGWTLRRKKTKVEVKNHSKEENSCEDAFKEE